MKIINKIKNRFRKQGYSDWQKEYSQNIIDRIRAGGGIVGENVSFYDVKIDLTNTFLYNIGNNVILTNCRILNHDASMMMATGYSKIGKITIGDNVFIGADSILLPNIKIGNNVIVGSGTVISKDIADNSVVVGNPCRVVSTYDNFVQKNLGNIETSDIIKKGTLPDKETQKRILEKGFGYSHN